LHCLWPMKHIFAVSGLFPWSAVCCWYWYQNLGGAPPPGAGHAFPRQWYMCRWGVIYFCQGFLPCMMPFIDGWWDGWMKASRKTIMTSFTICNHMISVRI
jgi:hypothetical protein